MVNHRSIVLMYVYMLITLGIYFIYWYVSTKNDMNKDFGADIPTAWLLIIPFAGFYWMYKYYEAFASKVKKDNNGILYFILSFVSPVSLVMPGIVQSELNKH